MRAEAVVIGVLLAAPAGVGGQALVGVCLDERSLRGWSPEPGAPALASRHTKRRPRSVFA